MCFIPAVLSLISRPAKAGSLVLVVIDIVAIGAQSTGFWALPTFIPSLQKHSYSIPVALSLISLAWWQNFVHSESVFPPIRGLARFASRLSERRSKTYAFVSLWKMCIYVACMFLFMTARMGRDPLFQKDPFGEKLITITGHNLNSTMADKFVDRMNKMGAMDVEPAEPERPVHTTKKPWNPDNGPTVVDTGDFRRLKKRAAVVVEEEEEILPSAFNVYGSYVELNQFTSPYDALWIVLVQVAAVFTCYHSSKFACKVSKSLFTVIFRYFKKIQRKRL